MTALLVAQKPAVLKHDEAMKVQVDIDFRPYALSKPDERTEEIRRPDVEIVETLKPEFCFVKITKHFKTGRHLFDEEHLLTEKEFDENFKEKTIRTKTGVIKFKGMSDDEARRKLRSVPEQAEQIAITAAQAERIVTNIAGVDVERMFRTFKTTPRECEADDARQYARVGMKLAEEITKGESK